MASWISAPECPLDLRGPVDRPFDRMGRGFSCIAALQHLTTVARKFPDEIAISDGASKFSYSALLTMVLALAEVIAATVAEKGKPERRIVLGNSVWHPMAILVG